MSRFLVSVARFLVFFAGLYLSLQCYWTQHWNDITVVYRAPCFDGAKPGNYDLCVAKDVDVTANFFARDFDVTLASGQTVKMSRETYASSVTAFAGSSPFTWRTAVVMGLGVAVMIAAYLPASWLRRRRRAILKTA